jgi:hypothetical protein
MGPVCAGVVVWLLLLLLSQPFSVYPSLSFRRLKPNGDQYYKTYQR